MIPELDRVSALMRRAAETEILPRFRALESHEIAEKSGPDDLVTAADLAVEAMLDSALRDLLPGSMVLGEEAAAKDRSVLGILDIEEWVWVIDPVDGTHNFAHGREPFGIIVSLVRRGEVVAGWIHDPLKGQTLVAEEGSGAYLEGERVHVAEAREIREMRAALYIGKSRAPALYERYRAIKDTLGPRSYHRCVAAEHWALATGALHYAIFTLQLPWDHAAGMRIFREAGGHLALIDGSPYIVRGSKTPVLLAPDPESWRRIRDYLAPFAAG